MENPPDNDLQRSECIVIHG